MHEIKESDRKGHNKKALAKHFTKAFLKDKYC
jgi:hypothetical protein